MNPRLPQIISRATCIQLRVCSGDAVMIMSLLPRLSSLDQSISLVPVQATHFSLPRAQDRYMISAFLTAISSIHYIFYFQMHEAFMSALGRPVLPDWTGLVLSIKLSCQNKSRRAAPAAAPLHLRTVHTNSMFLWTAHHVTNRRMIKDLSEVITPYVPHIRLRHVHTYTG